MRLAARYELDNLVVASVFYARPARERCQLLEILTLLSFAWAWKRPTVLGDGRHRGFGHGPPLRDGGVQHCDDENYKFEKECETRSHCVSVEEPSWDQHLLRHAFSERIEREVGWSGHAA